MLGTTALADTPIASPYAGASLLSEALADSFNAADTTLAELLAHVHEVCVMTALAANNMTLYGALTDSVRMEDATLAAWEMLIADSVDLDDTPSFTYTILTQITETLLATGLVASVASAQAAIAEALVLEDLVGDGWSVEAVDTAAFADALTAKLDIALTLIDSVAATGALGDTLVMTCVMTESLVIDETPTTMLTALAQASDTVNGAVSIRLGDIEYSAWVLNTETAGVSEYRNFDFESLTQFNGSYYGARDDGLYVLSGDTDQGDDIEAWIRTGLNNLGTGKMKNLPSMYLGYSASGEMVLKVVTTLSGNKREDWYRLAQRNADAPRSARISIGRGLKSVYWQFEIRNLDGADFDLENVELFPIVLDRRI